MPSQRLSRRYNLFVAGLACPRQLVPLTRFVTRASQVALVLAALAVEFKSKPFKS